VGQNELHHFDLAAGIWHGPDRGEIELPTPAPAGTSLKRRLFPSTLWEAGRRARRAVPAHLDALALDPDVTLVLHTTYLAPLLGQLPVRPGRTVVDAYDLVWRAHANDARRGPAGVRALRAAYAATVRPRELRGLRRADVVLVAGYDDRAQLASKLADVRWVPTPTPVDPVRPRPGGDGSLVVGLIGNFAHEPTRASAGLLARSQLVHEAGITIVLAGLGSEALATVPGVQVRGAVDRVEELYEELDCVVAPIVSGSGAKVKLGEALLAGRPVVTTPLGAAGFPPSVSRFFAVHEPEALDLRSVRAAIESFDPPRVRAALEHELGWEAATAAYEAATR
jgi:hypothetical protein